MQKWSTPKKLRVTWLSYFLLQHHIFKPGVMATICYPASALFLAWIPLFLSSQRDLLISRPLVVGYVGNTCSIILYYVIYSLYRRLGSSLKYAFPRSSAWASRQIRNETYKTINNDKSVAVGFITIFIICVLASAFSLYADGILINKGTFSFLYVLEDNWYASDGKFCRLLSLWIEGSMSLAIVWTGIWFEIAHWRMFRKLLSLPTVTSPIMIYLGFSNLWTITNLSSLGIISFYLFFASMLPREMNLPQRIISLFIIAPGIIGLLSPTYGLFRLLKNKKDLRIDYLLRETGKIFAKRPLSVKLMAEANVNSVIFTEYIVGSMQATFSMVLGILSILIAAGQIFKILG